MSRILTVFVLIFISMVLLSLFYDFIPDYLILVTGFIVSILLLYDSRNSNNGS